MRGVSAVVDRVHEEVRQSFNKRCGSNGNELTLARRVFEFGTLSPHRLVCYERIPCESCLYNCMFTETRGWKPSELILFVRSKRW